MLDTMHPEDVKAAIRKRFGTIQRFVAQHDLPTTAVSDALRGRTSKRVREAIEAVLADESIILDGSSASAASHSLNERAN